MPLRPSLLCGLKRMPTVGIALMILAPTLAGAAEQSFTDLPEDHYAYAAVEFLKSHDIVRGYEDGTYRPDELVNRAEALKFILKPLVSDAELQIPERSPYNDVSDDAWYLPYAEVARSSAIIDGPPLRTSFIPAAPVLKVEFLKMLLLARRIDPRSYDEIRLPLSSDVQNPDEWYYPYIRYALTSSMTMVNRQGTLDPARPLTRADTAVLLHRLLLYEKGERTQALLDEAESELLVILGALDQENIEQAEYASARALLSARGALTSKPNDALVKAALKITEGYRALIRAYRAGLQKNYDEVIRLSGDAWHLADRAVGFSRNMTTLSEQIKNAAKEMADSAREAQAGQ